MAVAALGPLEEYLSTTWRPDCEYVEGRLVERNVGELDHSYLQCQIAKLLDCRRLFPFIALRVQVKPDRFRIPDLLAVREMPSGRFIRTLVDKIDDYLEFGVENIWIVDPARRRVTIETREGGRICRSTVETADGKVSIPLHEIFGGMPSTEEE